MTELTLTTSEQSSLRDLFNTILAEVSQCELFSCDELTIHINDDTYYAFKYVDVDGHALYDICGRTISLVEIHLPKDDTCNVQAYETITHTNLDKMYRHGTTITIMEG